MGMVLARASLPGWCNPEAVYVARDDLLEAYSQPAWAKDALCREHPEMSFFPGHGESYEPARGVCARCIVRSNCLSYALSVPGIDGVWAGTSKQQRKHLGKVISSAAKCQNPLATAAG